MVINAILNSVLPPLLKWKLEVQSFLFLVFTICLLFSACSSNASKQSGIETKIFISEMEGYEGKWINIKLVSRVSSDILESVEYLSFKDSNNNGKLDSAEEKEKAWSRSSYAKGIKEFTIRTKVDEKDTHIVFKPIWKNKATILHYHDIP